MKPGEYIGQLHHALYLIWDGQNWIKDCDGKPCNELAIKRFLKMLEPTFDKL